MPGGMRFASPSRRPITPLPLPMLPGPGQSLVGHAVMEVDHTVAKSSLIEQIKSGADLARKSLLPTSHHYRIEKQMTLVDQVGPKRECCELGTTNGQVTSRGPLHLPDLLGVASGLDPGSCAGCPFQRSRENDLVRRTPNPCIVPNSGLIRHRGPSSPRTTMVSYIRRP